MTIKIQVAAEINEVDLALLCVMQRFELDNSRTPQRWEVLNAARFQVHQGIQHFARRFDRLKALGVIEHAKNGHCRLSDAGIVALAAVGQEHGHA